MLPEAVEAMTEQLAAHRQRQQPARLRARRPPGRRGVPGAHRRGARRPARARWCSPRAAPRRTTSRSRASTGPAATEDPRRHAHPDHRRRAPRGPRPAGVAGRARTARRSSCSAVDEHGRARPRRAARQPSSATRARSPWSRVMWANNEVGTLQPVEEVVALRARARHPGAHRRRAGGRRGAGRLRRVAASTR